MKISLRATFRWQLAAVCAMLAFAPVTSLYSHADAQHLLTHHVRPASKLEGAKLIGKLPDSTPMQLHIMLNLGDPEGLKSYVAQVTDPTSPNYKRYLTPQQFTERFGPSQQTYDTAVAYFKANGFNVVGGSRDGFDIQVKAPASTVEAAFHITVNRYQHPTENRTFIVPDREPTPDLPFQLWHITGLDTFSKPHPMLVKRSDYARAHHISPDAVVTHATTGSGPSKSFLGSDMRAAYYGGTTLTGAGIDMGLLEFLGTDLADLTTYYTNAHQTEPITPVLYSVDGVSTSCTEAEGNCDDTEQTIDMTQALGMAPGMSSLTEYFGNSTDTTQDDAGIISAMTTHSPLPITIGCSWGWDPTDESTLDPYFEKMAVQGQTFFAASGDDSTWTESNLGERSAAWPADDPYIISVGGTDLQTSSAAGPWSSETAWSDSGGGINQDSIPIPSYQALTGVITSTNKGSTTLRNGPDVSANANFTFYACSDQDGCTANEEGGTSFAAPMWAAYIALADQQAKLNGNPLLGFINPAIYPLGLGTGYATNFHDILTGTSGSNSANASYDLVTGWGSPNGAALITTLSAPVLTSAPTTGSTATSFAETLAYPGFDGTATIFDAVGSGTPATLGTCTESTTSLNSCTFSFLGSVLGPGPYNLSGQLTWVEITGTSTNSSETTKTVVATPITIIDATTTSGTATPSSIGTAGSSSVKVTVADSVTATFIPTGSVRLNLVTAGGPSLGNCTLSAGTCSATVQGSALATGSNRVVLTYPGVTNTYTASAGSVTVTVTGQTVPPTTATVSAVSSPYASTTGVTVTATESGSVGAVTGGVVTFGDVSGGGSFSPTTCTLTAGGTCTTTYLPSGVLTAGTYTGDITASFSAVGGYAAANGSNTLTITPVTPTLTISSITEVQGQVVSRTGDVISRTNGLIVTATGGRTGCCVVARGSTGPVDPSGVVTFGTAGGIGGTYSPTTCTLSNGTCSVTYFPSGTLAPGTYTNDITGSLPASTDYNAATGAGTLTVTGAAGGTITFSSVSHNFGQVAVGTAATAYGLTLTNGGSSAYPFSLVFTAANGFSSANNCGTSIAAGAKCQLDFYFTPTASGAVSTTWSLASENGFTYSPSNGGTLTGSGTTNGGVSLTTNGHNFGTVTVGTTSSTYGTELSNSTTSAETISLGTVSAPFTMLTNCGTTLAAGSSCEIEFTFTPTTTSPVSVVVPLSGSPAAITSGGVALPGGGITLSGN